MSQPTPSFRVGNMPIHGNVMLAPMAGYSDVPSRAISRAFGSAMNYTEFVPADALLGEPNPMWRRLDAKPGEHPLVYQIFGNDADKLLRAALRLEAMGPDIIDINMGCSVTKVYGRGSGVAMMTQPKLVAKTFRLLTRHLSVPVTGKIRLGLDDANQPYLDIGRIMEENGAALIAIHARTKQQRYGHAADWDAIGKLKQAVTVPVIGNGDVWTPADIDAMMAHTGCDGVMVGRGAVGNPWIFARRDRSTLTLGEIAATVRLHLREMVDHYGELDGLVRFHRYLRRYFSGFPVKRYLPDLLEAQDRETFDWRLRHLELASAPTP